MVPAYAGLLGSMGLAFLLRTEFLLPITVAALLFAVGALAYRARRRRGYGPLLLGIPAGALLLGGKFVVDVPLIVYLGIALLIAASVWNAWPKGTGKGAPTPAE